MKYRMYIDEVGTSDMKSSSNPNHRFLSLTGVIMELEHVRTDVFQRLEGLKSRYFESHPDEPLVLHRKELVNKREPFGALRDPIVEASFNGDLLKLLHELEYTVVTVVIDKQAHGEKYTVWKYEPYHYCLAMLVERYTRWLTRRGGTGDVMAESRGGKEDMRLKKSFRGLLEQGTSFMDASQIRGPLTSIELKVKPKSNNIAGLKLADLLAHPSYSFLRAQYDGQPRPTNFGGKLTDILRASKYDRSSRGEIEGWGIKWLP
ncbi:MAG: DUF3800 domain-containing protein [Candidatus Hydrogenedentes bacterium]|nr:DUF3800 domain-containing protein [Candidatus Hydrogenedentota bacterium]